MNSSRSALLRWFRVLGLVLVVASAAVTANSGGAPAATHAVNLEIDAVDQELGEFGVSRASLAELMTRRLEAGGVRVIAGTSQGQADAALLRLRVRLMRSGYVQLYGMNLSLHNKVPIEGGAAYVTLETWSDGGTGSISSSEVDVIGKFAAHLVDNFLAARGN